VISNCFSAGDTARGNQAVRQGFSGKTESPESPSATHFFEKSPQNIPAVQAAPATSQRELNKDYKTG